MISLLSILLVLSLARADSSKYGEALGKAREAALIQTGIQGRIDTVRSQMEGYALGRAEQLGIAKPLGAMLYCTKVYRDKEIQIPIASDKRLKLKTDQAAIIINF